ncbi:hypothetical protein HaLaN_10873, partial [Haematococcus lacustris]
MMQFPKGTPAGMVLVDEMQDFDRIRVEIIARLAATNPQLKVVACGDALQSVFSDVINEDDADLPGQGSHALSTWDMVPDMQHFSMDVCRRRLCELVRSGEVTQLMMHFPKGTPAGMVLVDEMQVCLIISHFRKADPSLAPEDVAIIALSTNKNTVFHHLITKLAHLYA